jgi:hypothetical protein
MDLPISLKRCSCASYIVPSKIATFEGCSNDSIQKIINSYLKDHKTSCKTELCLLNDVTFQKYSKIPINELKDIIKKNFKPIGPKNTLEWLNNINIDDTLKQWEMEFNKNDNKSFMMIPYAMDDFQTYDHPLNKLIDMIMKISNYIKYIACVLNTDMSTGSGKHWVCIFIDRINYTIEYFDSGGALPSTNVNDYLVKFVDTNDLYKIIIVNKFRHQYKTSECGVYCLWYIRQRLEGKSYKTITFKRIPDEDMEIFRLYLFTENK